MKKPFKFSVDFEYDHEPTSLSIGELQKIVEHLSKMSNSDYKFTFKAPTFLEVTDDEIECKRSN